MSDLSRTLRYALLWNIFMWLGTAFLIFGAGVSAWIIVIACCLHESLSDIEERASKGLETMTCPCCAKKLSSESVGKK